MAAEEYRQLLIDFPNQFSYGIEAVAKIVESNEDAIPRRPYSRVVVCGMGGSALGASLANTYYDLNPAIKIHRSYGLPNEIDDKTLIIVVSYSGNTEETLSALTQALEEKRGVVGLTCGGQLAEMGSKVGFPVVMMPKDMPPRLSLGVQFGALAAILAQAGVIKEDNEAIIEAATEIGQDSNLEQRGQELAEQIGDKIPLIYTSDSLGAIARNWKIKLNETAKIQAFWNTLPEANHNEINAFVNQPDRFHLITISDQDDHPRITKRLELTQKYARELGMSVSAGRTSGSSYLARILHTLWLGDWIAFGLAQKKGVDPAATPQIDQLKKDLALKNTGLRH